MPIMSSVVRTRGTRAAAAAVAVQQRHLVLDLVEHVVPQLLAAELELARGLGALVRKEHGRRVAQVRVALRGAREEGVALTLELAQPQLQVGVRLVCDLAPRRLDELELHAHARVQ